MYGTVNAPGADPSTRGQPGGLATLDADGKVPEAQLPVQGGVVAQDGPPDNTKLAWIDTASGNILKFYDGEAGAWKPVAAVWG